MELNSIVADMFKTAYICRHYKSRGSSPSDWPGADTAQSYIPENGLWELSGCRGREISLRPSSAVSASSSLDSATEAGAVNYSVGDGLGSVSSITESVNSWSFRFPDMPRLDSQANDAAEENSTLLIDHRRQSIVTSSDGTGNSSTPNVHSQVSRPCLVHPALPLCRCYFIF